MSFAASLGADLSSLSDGASPKGSSPEALESVLAAAEPAPEPIVLAAEDRKSLQSVLEDHANGFGSSFTLSRDGNLGSPYHPHIYIFKPRWTEPRHAPAI